MVDYTVELLNRNDLANSFFHLDSRDPTVGFTFDGSRFCGPTYPDQSESEATGFDMDCPLQTRLLVASHLAAHLRGQLECQRGYTSSVGVSTNKLLSKLVGSVHKPQNQTTLLAPYCADQNWESNVTMFLDTHEIQKVPGIGFKTAQNLRAYLRTDQEDSSNNSPDDDEHFTVRDLRTVPGMGPLVLDRVLGGLGAPRDIGVRIWGLIHGVDDSTVTGARDLPTQISIEDSFGGRLETMESVRKALVLLSTSLIRRMRVDLTEADKDSESTHGTTRRWLAHPRTLRLSTRAKSLGHHTNNRISRSAPLPQFVFNLEENIEALAERLVQESLVAVFRKLHLERSGWRNLSLLNIAVTNMVESAGERKSSSGRDIGKMFRTQEQGRSRDSETPSPRPARQSSATWEESDEDEPMPSETCAVCGTSIPYFARSAHYRFHLASG